MSSESIIAALLKSSDRLVAKLIRGKDLGQEDAEGDPRGVDSVVSLMIEVMAIALDHGFGEEPEEGESVLLSELIADRIELASREQRCRLVHSDLLGAVAGGVVRTTRIPAKEVTLIPEQTFK